jgi:nucleoid-associated protein YgaU
MELSKARAFLREVRNPASRVDFHYNPTTISFSKAADFKREPSQGAGKEPPVQFRGTQATQLKLQILLDAVEKQPDGSVLPEVEKLMSWTSAQTDPTTPTPSPAELQFTWGALTINGAHTFNGHLEQVEVTYEMFARDGRPIRAQVNLTLSSTPQEPAGTNPTSGGERPRRSHLLRRGEALQSVAYKVYGDAGRWRDIAAANGIDNPFRVPPGRELLLPDVSELTGAGRGPRR